MPWWSDTELKAIPDLETSDDKCLGHQDQRGKKTQGIVLGNIKNSASQTVDLKSMLDAKKAKTQFKFLT